VSLQAARREAQAASSILDWRLAKRSAVRSLALSPKNDYAAVLSRAGREAVPALVKSLGLSRIAAAETLGATAGLVLAALSRHQRKRPSERSAAAAVVEKYGRPADVDAPEIAIDAHLQHPRLNPRLGGLLGDAADRTTRWLAGRTGGSPEAISKAIAACAPLALGALSANAQATRLPALLAAADESALDAPERLANERGPCGDAFRAVRRCGRSRWLAWIAG
jgi:hypothetical protein